tara:strand:+ start:101 stop:1039 length:939 start_codon:yes stop_codon:yes gene_type:complete
MNLTKTRKATKTSQVKGLDEQKNEILTNFGLDFKVHKTPMVALYGNETLPTPYYSLINSKTKEVINAVSKGYHVSQNDEIVELILKGIAPFSDTLRVQKAGSLKGGRRVYVQLEIIGDGIVGKDTVKKYLTIIDSNDGSASLSVGIGDLTMSCLNQFFQFSKANQSRFKHTVSMSKRLLELPELIVGALGDSMKMIETYNAFSKVQCTDKSVHSLVNEMLGHDKASMTHLEYAKMNKRAENNMNALYSHLAKEIACKGLNLWGLHSGVTSWTTHEKQAPKGDDGRLVSQMIGSNYKANQKSLEYCKKELAMA